MEPETGIFCHDEAIEITCGVQFLMVHMSVVTVGRTKKQHLMVVNTG